MILSEDFEVAIVIEKLPPGWKDFKNYLKHKRKKMSMEDLIVGLRIEEDNRRFKKWGLTLVEAKANMVDHGYSSKKNKSGKGSKLGTKGGVSKKPKFQGNHEANVVDNIA